jgi:hypothetical protein
MFNEAQHSRRDVWSGRIFFHSTVLVVLATAYVAIVRDFNNASYHTLDDDLRKVADRYIKLYAICLIPQAGLGVLSYILKG